MSTPAIRKERPPILAQLIDGFSLRRPAGIYHPKECALWGGPYVENLRLAFLWRDSPGAIFDVRQYTCAFPKDERPRAKRPVFRQVCGNGRCVEPSHNLFDGWAFYPDRYAMEDYRRRAAMPYVDSMAEWNPDA